MVYGIEKFKEYFDEYQDNYVFIGGTACDLIMDDIGISFRATKDLDIVLIIEAMSEGFFETFHRFIEDGSYQHIQSGTGKQQFYRFTHPETNGFPIMIELFSRKPLTMKLRPGSLLTMLGP